MNVRKYIVQAFNSFLLVNRHEMQGYYTMAKQLSNFEALNQVSANSKSFMTSYQFHVSFSAVH